MTGWWTLIERKRMQTCERLDLLRALKRLVLIQALGGTLGLGTNFVVAGTLYLGVIWA